jgi:hypothetical protein
MITKDFLLRRLKTTLAVAAGAGLFTVLVVGWLPPKSTRSSAAKSAQSGELRVINRTRAFTVISATPAGLTPTGLHKFDISLRNDYGKTITAYALGSDGTHTRRELTNTGGIAPGVTVVYNHVAPPDRDDVQLTVLAVILEDGTGDGDLAIIREFLDARVAERVQLKRITALLELLSKAPDESFVSHLEDTKSKIKGLPDKEAERSFDYNAALRDVKSLELDRIEEFQRIRVERGNDASREAVKAHLEEKRIKIAKLRPLDERK